MMLHDQLRPLPWMPSLGQCMAIVNFAIVLWLLSFLPYVHFNLLVEAAVYVLVAWGLAAYLELALSSTKRPGASLFQASLLGIWLGPGFTLFLARFPLFVLAGAFILIATAHLFVRDLAADRLPRIGTRKPHLLWSLLAACLVQVAWLFYLSGRPGPSIVLTLTATAIVATGSVLFGAVAPSAARPVSIVQVALSIVAAIALAAVGMLNLTSSAGPFAYTRVLIERLSDDPPAGTPEPYTATKLHLPANLALGSDGVPGVVLRPKPKPAERITIPKLDSRILPNSLSRPKDPIRIPFTGEYQLFQAPLQELPRSASPVLTGDPFLLSFRTSYVSLFLEATQNLGRTVDLSCCSRLELEIRNQNPVPDESLELILIDSLAGKAQSLGLTPTRGASDNVMFRVPISPRIRQFDRFRVRFHRGVFPTQSSRIAIESTLLIPRL